jgi:hypothetical protein
MKNAIPERFQQVIETLPDIVKHSRGGGISKYAGVIKTVELLEGGKAIVMAREEFERDFGKHGRGAITTYAKQIGFKGLRTALYEGKVYIWQNKAGNK